MCACAGYVSLMAYKIQIHGFYQNCGAAVMADDMWQTICIYASISKQQLGGDAPGEWPWTESGETETR